MVTQRIAVFAGDTAAEVARGAADEAAELLRAHKRATVLFAVGESPGGLYEELAERRRAGTIDTSRIRAVQLDEYLGLSAADERSLHGWLAREILVPLGIPAERTIALRGDAADPAAECRRYEALLREAGGIDLAILGLGHNGHLGFNEPPSGPDAPTRVVELAAATIAANARYWGDRERVPRRAITAGMRVLLRARRTILVVTGQSKRAILEATLKGEVGPDVPASYLRTIPGVRVYADRAAW